MIKVKQDMYSNFKSALKWGSDNIKSVLKTVDLCHGSFYYIASGKVVINSKLGHCMVSCRHTSTPIQIMIMSYGSCIVILYNDTKGLVAFLAVDLCTYASAS